MQTLAPTSAAAHLARCKQSASDFTQRSRRNYQQHRFLDVEWRSKWENGQNKDMTNFSLISSLRYVTAASECERGGAGGGSVWAPESPNSLRSSSPPPEMFTLAESRLLSRGHTPLTCNKGRVKHSGRNLWALLTFFPLTIKWKSVLADLNPVAFVLSESWPLHLW